MIQFIKMEGIGNDYIYLDYLSLFSPNSFAFPSAKEIQGYCDRRFGVGSDGLVILAPSSQGDVRMWMWNADGSSSAMCGNALRCVAFLMFQKSGKRNIFIESGCGVHEARIIEEKTNSGVVEVNMGPPRFHAKEIPFLPEKFDLVLTKQLDSGGNILGNELFLDIPISWEEFPSLFVSVLSMGNPHCVLFVPDSDSFPLDRIGPLLESHAAFPERTNVEVASPEGNGWYQRTYERGSGETLACGSGACAVLVATVLTGRGPEQNQIRLRGGELWIEWNGGGEWFRSKEGAIPDVWMRGPVRRVFEGCMES